MNNKNTIQDTIISLSGVQELIQTGWMPERQYNKHSLILYHTYPYLPRTEHILESPVRECGNLMVKMSLNIFFQIDKLEIIDEDGTRIPSGSNLEKEVYERLDTNLEKIKTFSFKKDIKVNILSDYPRVLEYFESNRINYKYAPNKQTVVLGIPAEIWANIMISPSCSATYVSDLQAICYVDRPYKSANYFDSLLVHQGQHSLQNHVGLLMSATEAGLNVSDLDALALILSKCSSFEELSVKLNLEKKNLMRCTMLQDMRGTEHFKDRFTSPLEQNAIAEQMIFLIDVLNIPEDKIILTMKNYFLYLTESQWQDYEYVVKNKNNFRAGFLMNRKESVVSKVEINPFVIETDENEFGMDTNSEDTDVSILDMKSGQDL